MPDHGTDFAAFLKTLNFNEGAQVFLYPGPQGPGYQMGTLIKVLDTLIVVKDASTNTQLASLTDAFWVTVHGPTDAVSRIDVYSSAGYPR
jgi:hypothetical protein